MAIIPHVLSSDEAFKNELIRHFMSVENNGKIDEWVYADVKGVPTIGIGYAMVVFNKKIGEWEIRGNLDTQMLNGAGKTVSGTDEAVLENIVKALNDGDIEEASNLAGSDFSFEPMTDDEAKNLLNYAVQTEYAGELRRRIGDTVYNNLANSKEMIALLSIVYQGWGSAIKQPLIDALKNGNRAESWFQIRYAINTARADWMANRRYKEAEEFGLYDSGAMTDDEAKEVIRMSIIHPLQIAAYESKYTPPATISTEIGLAKIYLGANLNINGEIIVGAGLPTYAYMEGDGDDVVLLGTANNDLIFGEAGDDGIVGMDGNDVIYGGNGNDTIIGGKGNDSLKGGSGNDTYIYEAGDGDDVIDDTEGNDQIVLDDGDGKLRLGTFYKTGTNTWTTPDGEAQATKNSPLKITLKNGGSIQLTGDFQEGDFGIHLQDVPASLVLNHEIVETNWYHEVFIGGIIDKASNDHIVGTDKNDTISSQTGGDDWIEAGAGNDVILGANPVGNNIIEGGPGRDIIMEGPGDDRIFADSYGEMTDLIVTGETAPSINEKGDLISGREGNDYLYGSNKNDVLLGGSGEDLVVGGGGNDIILSDGIVGTYSDKQQWVHIGYVKGNRPMDYVYYLVIKDSEKDGVSTYYPIDSSQHLNGYSAVSPDSWSIEYVPNQGFVCHNLGLGMSSSQGDDVVYAGTGDDVVLTGKGDDEINAGPGDDTVFGQAGNDSISGGDGNDYIDGNEGNDFIDGGAGDDNIFGDDGADTIYGGNGNDYIEGNTGGDYIDGEAGNDTIFGNEGNDSIFGGDGNDAINGGSGSDYINSGTGDDKLSDGKGTDILFGGEGADTYYLDSTGRGFTYVVDDFDNEKNIVNVQGGSSVRKVEEWAVDYPNGDTAKFTKYEVVPQNYFFVLVNTGGSEYLNSLFNAGGMPMSFDEFEAFCSTENEDDYNNASTAYTPPRRDPLILDLDKDGIETKRINTSTYFDHDANGLAERTGWVNKDDGLLAIDKNNDGKITDGNELFGDNTILKTGKKAANGFEALSEFDTNKDGVIDANDPIFEQLRVWQDTNEDAVSTPEELHDLNSLGIKAINLNSTIVNQPDANGNTIVRNGSFVYQDNTESTIAEYGLQRNITNTIDNNLVDIPEDIALLPDLQGSGKITSLQQAMAKDTSGRLKNLVSDFINSNDVTARNSLMEQILAVWTGTESVASNSRGTFIDAKKLAVVEAFMGRPFTGFNGPNPNDAAAPILNEIYRRTSETYYAELMKQTQLKGLFENVVSYWDDTQYKMIIDLSSVAAAIKDEMANDTEKGKALLAEFARTYRATNDINTLGYLNFREEFINTGDGQGASGDELGWIIDSGGLPVLNTPLGTNGSEAIKSKDDQSNYLRGNNGNDVIYGSSLNDSITNGTGDAMLMGGAGNDDIWAGLGNDILDGGEGNDSLYGGFGNDKYIFRRGSGKDTACDYDPTPNNSDAIYIGNFLSPEDISLRQNGNDLILQIKDTDDNLTVQGWFQYESSECQIEQIQFSNGTVWDVDTIKLMVIQGTEGNDTLIGYKTDDVITGLVGNDRIYGGEGNDVLDGGEGNDTLYGGTYGSSYADTANGDDTYLFGRGSEQDLIIDRDSSSGNTDTIKLASDLMPADVQLKRNGNNLELSINGTTDKLTVSNWFLNESSECQIEQIQFNDGTVWDVDAIKLMVLQGTEGNDTLIGYNATGDTINEFGVNDYLYRQNGDDVLNGGAGNDYIDGRTGNDTYLFGRGSGQDLIVDYDNTPGNIDTIQMASDIVPTDITYKRAGNDLYIIINNTSDRLQIDNWFTSDDYKIEQIRFSDGTIIDKATINTIVSTPSDSDDYLIGTPDADAIDGGGGNDEIYGLEGYDNLYGGEGNDTLDGNAGNDNLYGGPGDDVLYDNDMLEVGDGNDYLDGGEGNDRLYSEYGINTLKGGPGDDDIYYNNVTEDIYIAMDKGDGFDKVQIGGGGVIPQCATVQFGEGITPESLSVQINNNEGTGYGGSVQLAIGGYAENEGMLIEATGSGYGGDGYGGYGGTIDINNIGVDRFKFADGRELTLDQIIAMADSGKIGYQEGTSGDEFLLGSVAEDEIYGGEGNDKIDSRDRNDMIDGGTGNDVIAAGPGNDEIYGYDGDDIMAGGHGNDFLSGESGNDVYAFNRGDGQDSIGNYTWTPNGETDTLSFGNTITPQDITAYVDTEGNIVLTLTGTNDKVAVDWFDPYNNFEEYTDRGLLRAQFIDEAGNARVFDLTGIVSLLKDSLLVATADNPISLFTAETSGYELMGLPIAGGDYAVAYAQTGDLFALPTYISGTDGDDFIKGREGNDTIYAGVGNDVVTTGGGDDDIEGGSGNDTLIGGTGNDTYRFNIGDGVDTINDQSTMTETNMIKFGPGITPDDITLDHDQEAKFLILNISTNGDQIKLNNFDRLDPYGPHAIEYFMFDNGQILTYSQMIDKGFDINRTNEEGNILGTATTDRILGGSGNDTLTSGTGNDTLTGGSGDDTYKYNKGDGILTIDDTAQAGSGNTLEFGEGITTADIANRLTFEGNTLIIRVGQDGDEVHLTNFDPDHADTGPHAVEFYKFADGTIWSYSELVSNTFIIQGDYGDDPLRGTNVTDRLYGYEGSDVLNAGSGNDTLIGGENNDELTGGQGDDTYVFNLGDGVDTIQDTATLEQGNRILFGQGITPDDVHTQINGTTLIIQYGNLGDEIRLLNFNYNNEHVIETIEFADGSQVRLTSLVDPATEGDDVIVGTYFNDVINAKGGNDQVTTLNGDDTVDGGSGNDTISTGEGEDTLTGGLGNDTLTGGDGYDTYYFNLGDGIDTIDDLAVPGAGNRIIFGPGITLGMLKLTLDEQSGILRIQVGENGDALRLTNFSQQDAYGIHAIEAYQFNDGSYITYSELIAKGFDIIGTPQIDTLIGTNVNDRIWALESDDIITAGSGNDIINGGEGADTMTGGTGNDTYIVDNIGDITIENTEEGTDIAQSSVSYGLSANIEDLTLTGSDNINGTGNELDNVIIGNSGNNILNGGAGADILTGGAGDDAYVVDNIGDIVTENPGEGIEQIQASITYTLGENIENLALTGIENIDGTGNSLNNLIMGNSGNNLINGEAGNDILYGADGNDVINGGIGNDYLDGQTGDDQLNSGEGNDYVYGYFGNDTINGDAGEDILYGGPDNDTINGGTGNDYLEGESGDDVLSGGEGNDYVYGYFGNDTINGDEGDDILYGGPDNDIINGGIGNDYLEGEAGDDILSGSEGNDYVYGYFGNDVINGNEGDDILYGADGNDVINGGIGNDYLEGEAGEDTLIGGTGNDYLSGYIGNDTYIFNNGDGIDAISDCDTTPGNTDIVKFQTNPLDLIFTQLGNDLNIITNSTNDQVTVQNWYTDPAYQTEEIKTGDNKCLLNTQVAQLIQAMATFCTTNGVTWNQAIEQKPAEVQQVLAQYWSQS